LFLANEGRHIRIIISLEESTISATLMTKTNNTSRAWLKGCTGHGCIIDIHAPE